MTPEKRVEELELELANLKDQALRAMADAENVKKRAEREVAAAKTCLLYTSPSPRDGLLSRMPSSA